MSEETKSNKKTITVYATCDIVEGGERYAKGDAMEVTADRAKALGPHVTTSKPE